MASTINIVSFDQFKKRELAGSVYEILHGLLHHFGRSSLSKDPALVGEQPEPPSTSVPVIKCYQSIELRSENRFQLKKEIM